MDKIKNYVLIILFIVTIIFGFMWYCAIQSPKVIKETTTKEKKVTVNKIIYQDRVIDRKIYVDTGGHVVTQEHIVEKPIIHETTNTVEKEKEVIKYRNGAIFAGPIGSTDLKSFNYGLGASVMSDPYLFEAAYKFNPPEAEVSAKIKLFSW